MKKRCSERGCSEEAKLKGFCRRHYDKLGRPRGPCSIPGCDNRTHVAGLCAAHYKRTQRLQPLGQIGAPGERLEPATACDVLVRFPRELFDVLKVAAKRRGLTVDALVVRALGEWGSSPKRAA